MISGLEHFAFCRRQWALIHVEQLWRENVLTLEGAYMHERVHDAGFTELRGSTLLSRAMPVRSEIMRVTGECDMVELHSDPAGVPIQTRRKRRKKRLVYRPFPMKITRELPARHGWMYAPSDRYFHSARQPRKKGKIVKAAMLCLLASAAR